MDIIAAVGFIATFIGGCIAIAAYFNGKYIKEGVREIGEMISSLGNILERMDKRAEESHKEVLRLHEEALMLSEERHKELIRLFGNLFERIPERNS
ncbi:MAG: hypothetical protein AB1630_02545 [bacterium]